MANLLVEEQDQSFILLEMLELDKLFKSPDFSTFSNKIVKMVLAEAQNVAQSELMPLDDEINEIGNQYDPKTHKVSVPKCFHSPYKKVQDGEWLAMSDDPEVGGQGFPLSVKTAVSELFYAGCFSIWDCFMATHGIGKLIELYGTPEQQKKYMEKLYSADWGGTMCLTEPQAGSDVGALETSATKNSDGTYTITGAKIFITRGESDITENIIHAVLARIEGDPPGTKGISIFIIPKILVNDDGTLGEPNDVVCTGIEHKMGLNCCLTSSMSFGPKGKCMGYLLGEQGKGMKIMFNMMNEARLFVGLQALSMSSKAYLHAVDYTKQRVQGIAPEKKIDPNALPAPIIEHPDVKRMLLWMKIHVEGCRALTYFVSYCFDMVQISKDDSEKKKWDGLIELLTPIVKAYNSDRVWEITATAIQCAGGYGYCADLPFERIARDCKCTSIYEGTNGIQAMDLVFRKLILNKLDNFNNLLIMIEKTIKIASEIKEIEPYARQVKKAKTGLVEVVNKYVAMSKEGKSQDLYYQATPFLDAMGDVVLAWIHLWQLSIAYPKLQKIVGQADGQAKQKIINKKRTAAFYNGKVVGARYFIGVLLKQTFGKIELLKATKEAAFEISEKSFIC